MELVNRKITYRMYPNSEQKILLQDTLGLHCRVYNTFLEERKRCYEQGFGSLTFAKMCRELTQWRAAVPALDCLNAQSLQVTAKRVDGAFDGFFRRVKTGETPGYPRFKQPHRYPGWGYKTHGDGWRLFETPAPEGSKKKPRTHSLRLSGIGTIRLRGRGRFAGIPKTCEIVRKKDKWYISVTFDVIPKDIAREPGTETAAFDWGVKNLLTIAKADGTIETFDNPKWLRKRLDAMATLQRVVSKEERKVKASIGLDPDQPIPKGTRLPLTLKLKRLYKQVSALHGKIANQRHDLHHKLSAFLVSRFGCLASEVLDVEPMVKKPAPKVDPETGGFAPNGARRKAVLNRNILDSAPATLLAMISTKAEEAATKFILADTKTVKPTQRCHKCGTEVPKELDERWHTCPVCYCHCDRDENAARTILRWLLEGCFWIALPWAGTVQPCTSGMEETPPIAPA
jgi:putative transposase